MTKFTLLATAALLAVSTAASAEGANNPTLADSIKAKWDAQTTRDSWSDKVAKEEPKAEPAKKAKKKWKKKKAAAKAPAAK